MADQSRTEAGDASSENGSLIRKLIDGLGVLLGARGDTSLRESLEGALEEHGPSEPSLSSEERLMLLNILKFNRLRVDDVMVPRADIVAVDQAMGVNDVLRTFAEAAHSRLVVFRETLDDPLGMYHIKDVIKLRLGDTPMEPAAERAGFSKMCRPVLFVPPSMPAIDLLIKMQSTRNHLALVIDEYGGTDGLVSIEDLVQEIVGEMEDSHDTDGVPELVPLDGGGYDVDARLAIEDLEKEIAIDLLPDERDEDLDTVGGLVVSLVGRVPQRGEIIAHAGGLEFEVLDADPRRLKRLRVRPASVAKEAETFESHGNTAARSA